MADGYYVASNSVGAVPAPTQFGVRVTENLFRRWFLFLAPIVLFTGLGVLLALRTDDSFLAESRLSASGNPLVGEQEIRGAAIDGSETPAAGTARIINERLATDAFAEAVAARAGLDGALERGAITLADVRNAVVAEEAGDTLLAVEATWGDPHTAYELVRATTASYLDLLVGTVSEDADAAVRLFEERRSEAETRAEQARDDFDAYVESLGGRANLLLAQELELARLNDRVIGADAKLGEAITAIEDAELALQQARSDAGQSLRVVDAPSVPESPESVLTAQVARIAAFFALGLVVAATALIVTTLLDTTVRSARDVELAGGGTTIAAVPRIKALRPRRRFRRPPRTEGSATQLERPNLPGDESEDALPSRRTAGAGR